MICTKGSIDHRLDGPVLNAEQGATTEKRRPPAPVRNCW